MSKEEIRRQRQKVLEALKNGEGLAFTLAINALPQKVTPEKKR